MPFILQIEASFTAEEARNLEEIKEILTNKDLASAIDKINDYFEQQDRVDMQINAPNILDIFPNILPFFQTWNYEEFTDGTSP